MIKRAAACIALVVFAASIAAGMEADNTFSTTVARAMLAMAITFVIGLIVGAMAQKMLDENLRDREKKLKNLQSTSATEGR